MTSIECNGAWNCTVRMIGPEKARTHHAAIPLWGPASPSWLVIMGSIAFGIEVEDVRLHGYPVGAIARLSSALMASLSVAHRGCGRTRSGKTVRIVIVFAGHRLERSEP